MKLKVVTRGGSTFMDGSEVDSDSMADVRGGISDIIRSGTPISINTEDGRSVVIPIDSIDYIEVLP